MAETQVMDDPKRDDPRGSELGEMKARQETMADGRRYIVYYTFGDESQNAADRKKEAEAENV